MLDYELTKNYLFKRYYNFGHSREDIEDLFHDTWLKMLEGGWPEGVGKFTAFLNAFRQLRYDRHVNLPKRYPKQMVSIDEEREEGNEGLMSELSTLYDAVGSIDTARGLLNRMKVRVLLTENEYDTMVLHIFKGYNSREIGDVRGVSYQAVHQTIQRVTTKLVSMYSS